MTTFKEISIDEYDKLIKNKDLIFAKTFKDKKSLFNYEKPKIDTSLTKIIQDENKNIQDKKFINELSDKISEKLKVSSDDISNDITSANIIPKYEKIQVIVIKNKSEILKVLSRIYNTVEKINPYIPDKKLNTYSLKPILESFENDENINDDVKYYFLNSIKKFNLSTRFNFDDYISLLNSHIDKLSEDDKKKLNKLIYTEDSFKNKLAKSLLETTASTSKDFFKGKGINKDFENIKINSKDLKNNILRVRYTKNNRKIRNKFLNEDMKISNKMKNAILKNTGLNKLSKNEIDVYNAIQKYKKANDNLLISSYLSGNKSKDLYNKISNILYNKYRNNQITKRDYLNIMNKIKY